MRYILKKATLLICAAAFSFTSCYDDILTFNEENNATGGQIGDGGYASKLTSGDEIQKFLRAGELLVIDSREHKYQYQFSLHVDDFAGYMCAPHNFEGRLGSTFAFSNDFASGPYANFQWVAQQVVPVMNTAEDLPQYKPLYGFAKLMFAQSAYIVAVIHGPVPFDDYRALKETHPLKYEDQSVVFSKMLSYIDSALVDFDEYLQSPDSEVDKVVVGTDMVTGKKNATDIVTMWKKYANSMKLRIAMTLNKVDNFTYNGKTPRQIAEEAVQNGVLEYKDSGIAVQCGVNADGGLHPLFVISKTWVDSRLNATLHNILLRTNNKDMLERLFLKNSGELISSRKVTYQNNSEFMSMRSGVYLRDKSNDQDYILYSMTSDYMQSEPLHWMKTEEVLFLRAEGALYGWNMGTDETASDAKGFYELGIKKMLLNRGKTEADAEQYLGFKGTGDDSIEGTEAENDYLYYDYYESDNNISKDEERYFKLNNGFGPVDTNRYTSSSDDKAQKEIELEKIMTQKWVAMFPVSYIAWTDIRRTGYPKILPAVSGAYKDSDGTISEETYVRRLPYSSSVNNQVDDAVKAELEQYAVPALNKEAPEGYALGDKQGTRLYWDVNKPNFN